jgi:hypothetical protein
MFPSGTKIGNEQLNILAYADDIISIGKTEIEYEQFYRNGNHCQKDRITNKPRKNKIYNSRMERD